MKNTLATNYLRVTSALEINRANSGHTGTSLGASAIMFSMYKNAVVDNKNPNYINRDRIVFSAGHASALIYATLNLFGFNISTEDLKNFRQLGSITTGHPEVDIAPGVDVSTGPLGQGIANAVGFAIAEEYLRNKFKKGNLSPISHYTYCFTGDGCLMEGVAQEALSIAGNLKLNKLILLYDKNDITIEGGLDLANREDNKAKFEAMGWNVLQVRDGNSVSEIDAAIKTAKNSTKPTVIIINTKIGFGSDLEGSNKIHGKPLTNEQINVLRQNLNYFVPDFVVPQEVQNYMNSIFEEKTKVLKEQKDELEEYRKKFPKEFKEFCELDNNFNLDVSGFVKDEKLKNFDARSEGHKILNLIGGAIPNLIGGCGDVAPSTQAYFDNSPYYSYLDRTGKNIPYGIREHAMGAITNGITLHKGIRAFCSTFFCFANYLTPSIRMAALMKTPVLYLFTHDSLTVGEDGPTHQAVEQIATLRCMPNLYVFRPSGRNEILAAYQTYFKKSMPLSIILPRLVTDFVEDDFNEALNGAYYVSKTNKAIATIIATGSEVSLALKAQLQLKQKGINVNVVSMPCCELFDEQPKEYKNKIIDKTKPVFCIEASSDSTFYKYATSEETVLQLNSFGLSGKPEEVYANFGFTPENVVNKVETFLKHNK